MMTYFGVNYFLGGMHSYASGSSFELPVGLYVAVVVVIALGIFAYRKQMKILPDSPEKEE
jgi:hypothetical protein